MWRPWRISFSTISPASPNEFLASRIADSISCSSPSRLVMPRMPLPPPPAAALSITGRPTARTDAAIAAGSTLGASLPGTIGTLAALASRLAAALSPRRSITSAVGPMNTRPAASTARAKAAFSARKPNPGWMASAPTDFAAAITASLRR
jgi:hypothetical protein